MLLKGTRTRSAEQIAREIESVGGSLDSFGGNNSFGVNAEVLSGDFDTGLDLVADVLLNPTFPGGGVGTRTGNPTGGHQGAEGPVAQERRQQPCAARCLAKPATAWIRMGTEESVRAFAGGGPQGFSPAICRAEQLRAGHLWRRASQGRQSRRDESLFGNWKSGEDCAGLAAQSKTAQPDQTRQ